MGYSTLLDILGSMVIGGILLTILLRLNDASTQKIYAKSNDLSIQQNLTTLVQIIEYDFRKIGYTVDPSACIDPRTNGIFQPTNAIISATETSLSYYADVFIPFVDPYQLGDLDSVRYYLGPTSECSSTPNPRDRILYRVVNDEIPIPSNLGVTEFRLVYYDVNNDTIPTPVVDPDLIQKIEINLVVEDVAAYDEKYSNAFWKQLRLASRNMSRSQID